MAQIDQPRESVSFCRLCEAFCGIRVTTKNGRVTRIAPDRDNPASQGHVCVKGTSFGDIVNDSDRVLHPLRRTGPPGAFERVSWDEALADIAARLSAIHREGGGRAVGAYFGNPGAFSTDALLSTQWFLDRLKSPNFYSAGSQDSTSRHLASHILYGVAFRNAIPDLDHCDLLIIAGANPLVSHGGLLTAPWIRHDLDAIAARGRVIVIDPRRSETAARYEHLPIHPGSDAWLFAALLNELSTMGAVDEGALARVASGWKTLRDHVATVSVADAAVRTGIGEEEIRALARAFAQTPRAAFYGRVGLCRTGHATLANVLLDCLNICAGKFGVRGGSTFGAFPLGGDAPLAGYRPGATRIGNLPQVAGMMPAAVLPDEILEPGAGQIRALFLVAGNPLLSATGGARWSEAFESLDLLVSSDLYMTESNRHAHYILPASSFLERDDVPLIGLSHAPRPFIQFAPAALPPMGEARSEFEMFDAVSRKMRRGPLSPGGIARLLARVLKVTPLGLIDLGLRMGPAGDRFGLRRGLSLRKLAATPSGKFLPLSPARGDWRRHISTPHRKLRLWHDLTAQAWARFAEAPLPEPGGLLLIGRRALKSMNSWMHNVDRLVASASTDLFIHPDDAARAQLADGDSAELATSAGRATVVIRLSTEMMPGAVSYPHGWGHRGGWARANAAPGININAILPAGADHVETISGTTLLDAIPVEIRPIATRQSPPLKESLCVP